MHKKLLKSLAAAMLLLTSANAFAQVNSYEVAEMGYLRTPMETANGIILTNSKYSEIYALDGEKLTPILQERNCGLYTNLSPDGKYLGFKSFNDADEQAPAILDVTTGIVTILEDYVWECGQVSFANDGTMAYTMGNRLIVRKGNTRKAFDLGFYSNIANISPDGTQVAYSNIDGQMFVINVNSGAKEIIPVTHGYRPIWSPDGSKIAIEIIYGTFAVQERATKKVFDLGQGEAISWANNSNELIFTKSNFIYDHQIESTSIKKINFDGSGEITLVESSDNLPSDAIITRDNKLFVPYKTGVKRGLVVKDLVEGITPSAASVKEEKVLSFDEETIVGLRHSNANDNPNIKPSPVPAEGTIGALDIPYLSQIYDSPAVNGCTAHGHVTCAPTSACMFLGYYDLLPQKTTTSRSGGTEGVRTQKYAHAISAVFTNKAGTTTFNTTAYGNGCYNVPGGYGYMWNGDRMPSSGYMNSFITLNGATSSVFSNYWSTFVSQVSAGYPFPFCASFGGGGHVVLGFRTNQYYRTSEGGFVAKTGCFVCHDPYGDYNDSYWADNDGQHSSYDWPGYNSGRSNIVTFYWGVKATAQHATPVEKKITSNPSSIELKGELNSSTNVYADVKITATGLSKNMSVASATGAITVATQSDWNSLTGGTVRCTLNTSFGVVDRETYIAVQSGSDANNDKVRLEIPVKMVITDPNAGTTEPEPSDPNATLDDQNIVLTEVWKKTTADGWFSLSAPVTRSMAYKDGKLYVLNARGATAPVINIVDAYTGAAKGTLSVDGVAGGAVILSNIVAFDGKIYASNRAAAPSSGAASETLKIYRWDSDSSTPVVIKEDATHGSLALGGKMMLSGNSSNGRIWFGQGTTVVYYDITNGTVGDAKTIALTKDGSAHNLGANAGETDFVINSDGTFWADGKDKVPALFNASGVWQKDCASIVNGNANSFKLVDFGTRKLAAIATYMNKSATTLADGAFVLADVANGVDAATAMATYPETGFVSATRNTQFMTTLCVATDRENGMVLDVWYCADGQGIGFYSYNGKKGGSSAIEDIFSEEVEAPAEYYNLQGMKVANPTGGIFIKVQGNKVTKEYIK